MIGKRIDPEPQPRMPVTGGHPSRSRGRRAPQERLSHTSDVLQRLHEEAPRDHFTLRWPMERLPNRSFGMIMLLLAKYQNMTALVYRIKPRPAGWQPRPSHFHGEHPV